MLLGGYLRLGGLELLRPLRDLRVGAHGLWFLNNQLLPFSPIGRQRLDGLDDALAQDGSNRHIVSSISIYRWLLRSILNASWPEMKKRPSSRRIKLKWSWFIWITMRPRRWRRGCWRR